jgi:steroid delta-isomerase-like uncharacterized protein
MTKDLKIITLAAMLGFSFACRDKAAMAELEAMKAQAALEEQNKSLVLRWFGELSESRFESLYEAVFSPDSKQYMPPNAVPLSFEEFKPLAAETYKAFPLIDRRVEDIIAEGDKVVAKVLVHAVHGGEFAGVPATGRTLEWTAIAIFQIEDGKVTARWEIADILGIYEQLGLELAPEH